jgi:zinc protease
MEHMNFNGTKRFPKNKLVDYLQSIGVKLQHLNVYTSFDETVYFLPIPSDSPEKLENGFNIIEDWAFNADLSPEEIEKEEELF